MKIIINRTHLLQAVELRSSASLAPKRRLQLLETRSRSSLPRKLEVSSCPRGALPAAVRAASVRATLNS